MLTPILVFLAALLGMPQTADAAPQQQLSTIAASVSQELPQQHAELLEPQKAAVATSTIPDVPFYSQFKDITSSSWQKVGCGITDLAMLIDYYKPAVSVDTLLKQGIAAGAYLQNAGWTYAGLISVGKKYGLTGSSHDLGKLSNSAAFAQLSGYLKDGPVIVSVHYQFDPKSTIPHLVVINGIDGDSLYYNDPAAKVGAKKISTADFLKAWKKRFIVMRPLKETLVLRG